MSNTCAICDQKIGMLAGKIKIKSGDIICKACIKQAGFSSLSLSDIEKLSLTSLSEIKDRINNQGIESVHLNFSPTFKAGELVLFDDNNRLIKTNFSKIGIKPKDYLSYDDIMDMNIVEDNNIVKKSGAGGALGGALLFGPAGAIIGGLGSRGKKKKEFTEKLHINLILKDGSIKTLYILDSKTKHSSFIYKAHYEIFQSAGSKFEDIINSNNATKNTSQKSVKDELLEYKELLDLGIITQEEFDVKKLEVLRR